MGTLKFWTWELYQVPGNLYFQVREKHGSYWANRVYQLFDVTGVLATAEVFYRVHRWLTA